MNKTFFICCGILLMAMLFVSCNKDVMFNDSVNIPKSNWNCDSIINFDVEVTDTVDYYQMEIIIRNSGKYEFQNIWLFVEETLPDKSTRKDTLEYFLADDYGRWFGSGIGSLYTNSYLFKDSVKFNQAGIYKFGIGHGMRTYDLCGISDIGLKIFKDNK